MPIRYDAILARALAGELNALLSERMLEELHFDPARRAVRIVCEGGDELAWLLHPSSGHLLRRRSGLPLNRRRDRGRGLLPAAVRIVSVLAGLDERRITVEASSLTLVIELHTNQWNALLVAEGRIRAALWPRRAGGRSLFSNSPYLPPGANRRWVERPPEPQEWQDWWNDTEEADRAAALVREVAWTSRLNSAFVLSAGSDHAEARRQLLKLHPDSNRSTETAPPTAWLLAGGPIGQPYPQSLGQSSAKPVESLLAAMEESARNVGIAPPDQQVPAGGDEMAGTPGSGEAAGGTGNEEIRSLAAALKRQLARARKRTSALGRQLAEGPASAELREAGQLLLAHKRSIRRGADSAALPGFDGTERRIELDPALDVVANAQRYFQRARRRERAERDVPARVEAARAKELMLAEGLMRLTEHGVTEELWSLAGGRNAVRSTGAGANDEAAPLPYRRFLTGGGREIRVGRSARGNDDLTFRHSAPDDIWLHVRQAPGAHVILRWGQKDQNPPEAELRDAALAAAEYSDARSSGMVPVDWTRRKYVRKPRKSPPGTVIPDRVKTIFVEPDPIRVRQMKEAGPDAP